MKKLMLLSVSLFLFTLMAAEPCWITVDDPAPAADRGTEYVRTFANRGDVKKAVWTMTGLGVFDAYVNGRLVGDDVLKPGYTHHEKTKYLFGYDVTSLLKTARGATNVLASVQSGGWWSDRCVWGFKDGTKRKTAFRAELVLTYADGAEERIVTDRQWRAAYAGPVVTASIWEGETYDARLEPKWRTTGVCDFPAAAIAEKAFAGEVLPLVGPKVGLRTDLTMRPVTAKVWREAEGVTDTNRFGRIVVLREVTPRGRRLSVRLAAGEKLLLDFGQNAAAEPWIEASAATGVRLVVRGAEMLNDGDGLKIRGNDGPGGSPYYTNYRASRNANFTYFFAGTGVERAMPRHTFFGYRYLQLETDGDVELRSVLSVPVTSVEKTAERGTIVTGDASLNRLIKNCLWGMYSNYLSVPMDCPQRDERQGWAGDTQVFALAATYVADVRGFLRKWMRDMRDTQLDDGGFAIVAPCGNDGRTSFDNNIGRRFGWSDAGVIVPYTVWKQSGDTTIVEENWQAMTRYLDLLERSKFRTKVGSNQWHDAGFQFGDWLSYERWESWANWDYLMTHPDAEDWWNFLGGCYWRSDAQMMAEMAAATGRVAEAKRFADMAEAALAYLRKEFLAKDGLLLEKFRDMQTANLFALKTGIYWDEAAREMSVRILRDSFAAHGGCLQTGFLGTSILLDVVTEHLGMRAAYDLLLQRKEPSWLFTVDNGATTMWERWNSYTKKDGFGKAGMNSFNHYAYGAVMGWMYRTMAGIRADEKGGWKRFTLAPHPDSRVGSVSADYKTGFGVIKSAWNYGPDGTWRWTFTIPEGSEAKAVLPDGTTRTYGPGNHVVETEV